MRPYTLCISAAYMTFWRQNIDVYQSVNQRRSDHQAPIFSTVLLLLFVLFCFEKPLFFKLIIFRIEELSWNKDKKIVAHQRSMLSGCFLLLIFSFSRGQYRLIDLQISRQGNISYTLYITDMFLVRETGDESQEIVVWQ